MKKAPAHWMFRMTAGKIGMMDWTIEAIEI